MASLGKMRRQYTKDQMAKLRSDNLVSDRETQAFADTAREAGQASLQAQTAMLNRASAANKAGSPVLAGTLKDTAEGIAQKGSETAVKATGQGQMMSEALKEQRKGSILEAVNTQIAQNRADLGMALDTTAAVASMVAELGLVG